RSHARAEEAVSSSAYVSSPVPSMTATASERDSTAAARICGRSKDRVRRRPARTCSLRIPARVIVTPVTDFDGDVTDDCRAERTNRPGAKATEGSQCGLDNLVQNLSGKMVLPHAAALDRRGRELSGHPAPLSRRQYLSPTRTRQTTGNRHLTG